MPGGLTLLAALPASIPTPAAGKVTIFFNLSTSAPSYKNDAGTVYPLAGMQGPIGLPGNDGEAGVDGLPGVPGIAGVSGAVTFSTRKSYLWLYNDLFTSYQIGIGGSQNVGGLTNVQDVTSSYKRLTSANTADAPAGVILSLGGAEAPHFNHVPSLTFRIRTGAAITASRLWIGCFDNVGSSTNPGISATGVNTARHMAFRYVDGLDPNWVISGADGTTQGVVDLGVAIAPSTIYTMQIRFLNNLTAAFSINGSPEVSVTLNSNAADSTDMYQAAYVFNVTGGNTRFIDSSQMYADYN